MNYYAKRNIFSVLAVVIIMLVIFGYHAGYRVGTFGIGRLGTIELTPALTETNVFVDASQELTTATNSQKLDFMVTPTTHQVIVSHVGYFPWTKKVVVPSLGKVILNPIFVPQNTSGQIITLKDQEYWTLRTQVSKVVLPTKDAPFLSADKSRSVWVENNIIFVQTGTNTTQVIAPEPIIKNVAFYKNRSDVLLFSAGDGVFVIETDSDPVHIQNVFPVFKGTDPHFLENSPDFMYVLDGTTLMQVII